MPTSAPRPERTPDPATATGLAELFQLGLTVARATAELAEVERQSIAAIAEAAAEATRAAATATSLADALAAGRHADAMDAGRDALTARIAVIAESFDKAARAVRRTAALQARLADPRPFGPPPSRPAGRQPPQRPASPRPANDRDSPDRPETGDELGTGRTDHHLRSIPHDLAAAATLTSAPSPPRPASPPDPTDPAPPASPPQARPPIPDT